MQNVGQPGHIIITLNRVLQVIAVHEIDPIRQFEALDGFFGKRPGGRQIVYGGLKAIIGEAIMDGVGAGTTTQIKEMLPVGHIDGRNDVGRHTHGHIKHAHQKTFAPFLLAVRRPRSLGFARFYGLIQL